jgi:hypoxanthine phosphoribosyltransferase
MAPETPTTGEMEDATTGASSTPKRVPQRRQARKPAQAAAASAELAPLDAVTDSAENDAAAPRRTPRRRRGHGLSTVTEPTEENAQAGVPEPEPSPAEPASNGEGSGETGSSDAAAPPARPRRRGHRGGVGRRRPSPSQVMADIAPLQEPELEFITEVAEEQNKDDHDERLIANEKPAPRRMAESHSQGLEDIDSKPSQTQNLSFMHPSEREFANLLDYYHIKYLYEPRSFPLRWDGNRVTEMHTPDFYLPEYDQYFELTTMKQNLVTQKNRKLRHVQEMYPEVNIQLLYRRDLMRLMGKYGFGPLADVDVTGTDSMLFSQERVSERVKEIGQQITEDYKGQEPVLIGVLRGVVVFMADLMRNIELPMQIEFMEISHYGEERESAIEILRDVTTDLKGRPVIVVEDIVDTGLTLSYLLEHLKSKRPSSVAVCALLDKSVRRMAQVPLAYVGFQIPDELVIGYGLDYGGRYRNLPYIGVLKPVEPKAVAQR